MSAAGPNLALAHEAIAAAVPDRDCLVWRDGRRSWAEVTERSRRLASVLRAAGLGCFAERDALDGWERGQHTLALFLYNGPEYLEAMVGAYKARVAPFNVNYRYTAAELAYVLVDSGASAVVHHASLGPVLAEALRECPGVRLVLTVDDDPAVARLPGALGYEAALAGAPADPPDPACSPDDLYVLYTGGTTGRPKGVLWRQADFTAGALGVTGSPDALAAAAARSSGLRVLPTAPFMHGAAHWNAWSAWLAGGTVVAAGEVHHLDPADVWATAERERVGSLQLVGDSFARPLLTELDRRTYDLSALRFVVSGGALLSAGVKAALVERLPRVRVLDIVGSSEAGRQGVQTTASAADAGGAFAPSQGATVLDEALSRELEAGSAEVGWLAKAGAVPLGYLGDPQRTARTFPVVGGIRYSVPGDRARRRADGTVELLGRDAVCINTGGEKVFAEEVEAALLSHPAVWDVIVVGRPSERWGQEVVAVVQLRSPATDEELREHAATQLARYKLPKAFVRRDRIERFPNGKPDYGWARTAGVEGG